MPKEQEPAQVLKRFKKEGWTLYTGTRTPRGRAKGRNPDQRAHLQEGDTDRDVPKNS